MIQKTIFTLIIRRRSKLDEPFQVYDWFLFDNFHSAYESIMEILKKIDKNINFKTDGYHFYSKEDVIELYQHSYDKNNSSTLTWELIKQKVRT